MNHQKDNAQNNPKKPQTTVLKRDPPRNPSDKLKPEAAGLQSKSASSPKTLDDVRGVYKRGHDEEVIASGECTPNSEGVWRKDRTNDSPSEKLVPDGATSMNECTLVEFEPEKPAGTKD